MDLSKAIAFVRRYNRWRRRDDDSEMPSPREIGQALGALCDHAERMMEAGDKPSPTDDKSKKSK